MMFNNAIRFLFCVLIFVLVTDPADLIFHLKTPLFALIFFVWGMEKIISKQPVTLNKDILAIVFVFLLIPILGLVSGLIQSSVEDFTFVTGFIKSISVMVLLIVIMDKELVIDQYLNRICIIIPLVIIPTYYFSLFNIDLFVRIYTYLNFEKDAAKFSNRVFYGIPVAMFYYRTSPLLVFPLSYYCYQFMRKASISSFLLAVAFFFTLILSGTRANMLCAALIVVYVVFVHQAKKRNKLPFLVTASVIIFSITTFLLSLSLSEKDSSAEVKSSHINSMIKLFNDSPEILVWGQGLGSTFYSEGFHEYTVLTEFTYFELVRMFGIPLTIILLFLIVYPVIYLYNNKMITKENKYTLVAYASYLFISGTNPLLVSSTGILVILTMYSLMNAKATHEPVSLPGNIPEMTS